MVLIRSYPLLTPAAEVRPKSRGGRVGGNARQVWGSSEGSLGSSLSLEILLQGVDAFREQGQRDRPTKGKRLGKATAVQRIRGGPLCPTTRLCPGSSRAGGWGQATSHIQASRLRRTPRLTLGPSYHSYLMGGHSYLMGGLGWWILQVSGPATPYLDGLAQEWRAPLGVGEVCRHGG